jgi:hypothetical protein
MVFTNRLFKRRLTKKKAKKSKKPTRKQRGGNVLDGRIRESRYAKYGTETGIIDLDF